MCYVLFLPNLAHFINPPQKLSIKKEILTTQQKNKKMKFFEDGAEKKRLTKISFFLAIHWPGERMSASQTVYLPCTKVPASDTKRLQRPFALQQSVLRGGLVPLQSFAIRLHIGARAKLPRGT